MEALVKRNGSVPLTQAGFLPTMNTFFDDFLSKDLMENDWPKFRYIRNQFAICQFKRDRQKIEIELAAPGLKKKILKLN
jgi:HSP20 family protein